MVADNQQITRLSFLLAEFGEIEVKDEIWFPRLDRWPSSFAEFRTLYDQKDFYL